MRKPQIALLVGLFAAAAFGQVPFTVIDGDPLEIHVGADNSFQIFNAAVPGQGQIFPSTCANTADMGIFADINGTLFSPDFSNHGCGTATGNLGERTPWSQILLGGLSGAGTAESPFTVVVTTQAGATGLRLIMTVQYVNGQNFFRLQKRFVATATFAAKIFEAADIFLADSDSGQFHLEPSLNAPGGQDCGSPPTYTILLIPVTAADRFTAAHFSVVWQQIGAGDLDNAVASGSCQDNGAGIQWNRSFAPGQEIMLRSAVSFGTIPDPANFQRFSIQADPSEFTSDPGQTLLSTLTTGRHDESFNAPLTLSVGTLPPGFTATITPTTIAAPGNGTAQLRLQLADNVLPGTHVIRVFASGEDETTSVAIFVHVICDPPFILGNNQPEDASVPTGSRATVRVTPSGSGPFQFQWYFGPTGSTFFPVEGATAAELSTPAVLASGAFWVRISNACGSVDSRTVRVSPTP
jgi:hypothetical protein